MSKVMSIKKPESVPDSEWDKFFMQGMVDRMGMSFFKYGPMSIAYPEKVNAIESLKRRLDKYEKTGNTEWLIDAANFAMIEFMRPAHPDAHFKSTDSHESPGRKWRGELNHSARHNAEL
jgi:hypothetical protein